MYDGCLWCFGIIGGKPAGDSKGECICKAIISGSGFDINS